MEVLFLCRQLLHLVLLRGVGMIARAFFLAILLHPRFSFCSFEIYTFLSYPLKEIQSYVCTIFPNFVIIFNCLIHLKFILVICVNPSWTNSFRSQFLQHYKQMLLFI